MAAGAEDEQVDDRTPEQAMREAKRPSSPVAGLYGRPLHPLLASVALGAWVCSFGFDLISQVANDPGVYSRGAYWLVLIGIGFGLLAATVGLLDVLALPRGTRVFRTGLQHLIASDVAVLVFLASFLLRRELSFLETPWSLVALSAVGLGALAASSWTGLDLSYRWGVRVVDEAEQVVGYERAGATTAAQAHGEAEVEVEAEGDGPTDADEEVAAEEAEEPPEDGGDVGVATHRT